MNDHHQDGLDLELKNLLSVAPSPDLQARIRSRTTAAPETSKSWWGTIAAGFAFASALVLVVFVFRAVPEKVAPTQPFAVEQIESPPALTAKTTPVAPTLKTVKTVRKAPPTQLELMLAMQALTFVERPTPVESSSSLESAPLRTMEIPVITIEAGKIGPLILDGEE
jgi:hypothetical protein